ncbi:MAG: AAA family ATPase [Chthoniobacterales bacterium]
MSVKSSQQARKEALEKRAVISEPPAGSAAAKLPSNLRAELSRLQRRARELDQDEADEAKRLNEAQRDAICWRQLLKAKERTPQEREAIFNARPETRQWIKEGQAANAVPTQEQKRQIPKKMLRGESPDPEEQLFENLLAKYQSALCTSAQLETFPITPRAPLLGKWMKEGDLGFCFGRRDSGKTWFVYLIATTLSTGRPLKDCDWDVPRSVDVLLVDGEMPLDDCRNRLKGLTPLNVRLHLLHHEMLFEHIGSVMNLTEHKQQRVITELCLQTKAKLLVLDNLSCLFSGLKENDADAWELVLNWLLELRRRRIAVLIVHHTGHDGEHMRGTSKREDAAFWVIAIKELADHSPQQEGARFETTFTKQRNSDSPESSRQWILKTETDGTVSCGCVELSFDEKVLASIQAGLHTNSEIAEELKVAKSTVSKAATRLERDKFIERRGNGNRTRYEPRGFMHNETHS